MSEQEEHNISEVADSSKPPARRVSNRRNTWNGLFLDIPNDIRQEFNKIESIVNNLDNRQKSSTVPENNMNHPFAPSHSSTRNIRHFEDIGSSRSECRNSERSPRENRRSPLIIIMDRSHISRVSPPRYHPYPSQHRRISRNEPFSDKFLPPNYPFLHNQNPLLSSSSTSYQQYSHHLPQSNPFSPATNLNSIKKLPYFSSHSNSTPSSMNETMTAEQLRQFQLQIYEFNKICQRQRLLIDLLKQASFGVPEKSTRNSQQKRAETHSTITTMEPTTMMTLPLLRPISEADSSTSTTKSENMTPTVGQNLPENVIDLTFLDDDCNRDLSVIEITDDEGEET